MAIASEQYGHFGAGVLSAHLLPTWERLNTYCIVKDINASTFHLLPLSCSAIIRSNDYTPGRGLALLIPRWHGLPQQAHSWPAWSQRVQDDDLSDDPLLDDFKLLRRRVFQWHGQCFVTAKANCMPLPKLIAAHHHHFASCSCDSGTAVHGLLQQAAPACSAGRGESAWSALGMHWEGACRVIVATTCIISAGKAAQW